MKLNSIKVKDSSAHYRSYTFLASLLSSIALWQHLNIAASEITLVVIFIGLLLLFRENLTIKDIHIRRSAAFFGLVFALFMVLARLDIMEGRKSYLIWMFIRFAGFSLVFSALLSWLYSFLKDKELICADAQVGPFRSLCVFFGAWFIFFAVFLVWLLYEFPGWMSPDSSVQLMQATGAIPMSDAHPFVHTLIIKLIYQFGLKMFNGNASYAVALYSGLQALFMAMCYAFLTETLYRVHVRKYAIFLVFLCYIVLPFHGSYSITMWKDVPFAGIMLLLCCSLFRIIFSVRNMVSLSLLDLSVFFLSSIGMCLFRSNGLYAYILLAPFVFFLFIKRSKPVAATSVVVLVIAFVIKGPVYSSMEIYPFDTIEALSIPAQHIARAVTDGAELTEEQYELLSQVVDVAQIPQAYNPNIADPIKILVRYCDNQEYLSEHKIEFLKLWLNIGLKNPGSYIKAQADLTRSYWYPNVSYWAKSYYTVPEGSGIALSCKLPSSVAAVISGWSNFSTYLPFLGLLFSIGASVWLYIALFGLCIAKRRYSELVLFIPVLAVWVTLLIASPLDNEFRYAYCVFTTLPLMCVVPFTQVNCDKVKVSV